MGRDTEGIFMLSTIAAESNSHQQHVKNLKEGTFQKSMQQLREDDISAVQLPEDTENGKEGSEFPLFLCGSSNSRSAEELPSNYVMLSEQ